ncbi:DUF2357 domain-containing protein [uncultured Methanobrevibacter sp.]|uniref:DUF2357 domain-containing protein n=1 Tax=uncultured Methanobrevibacter sp. TaxID=253161 RepID=UPI0025D7E501|nr:DUF2357 domain-containing protein [uncultured Methanobrevibacter sp.]
MIEQKVTINLKDEFSKDIGTLTVSSIDPIREKESSHKISDSFVLKNIDLVDEVDNITPIQYYNKESSQFSHLMLLEETEYQILFESDDANASYDVLYSLIKINESHFKRFRFNLGDNNKFKLAGTLNFRSYVGKSFLDVKKDNIKSIQIPIEVRSKKIDYFNQYSAMIADLSQHALSLIFEVNSPLYQEFELANEEKLTYYEDFMFLEYLFRQDNLPTIFEYLSKNMHSQLINHDETVPISLANNLNSSSINNIVSKPNQLFKTDSSIKMSDKLNGYLPYDIHQIKHEESIDTPENQFFKYFLEMLQNFVEKMLVNSKKGYIQDKLNFYKEEISYYLSAKFFNHISTLDYVPFNSQVLQKKEGYRDIFQYFLMLEFSFRLSWDDLNNKFKGFEKKLSELYEYWCYFEILKVLNDLSITKINFEDVFEVNKTNWAINVIKGKRSSKKFKLNIRGQDVKIELFYNLTFSDKSDYKSYSLAFKPDYTLLISTEVKQHFIHFDAKYRSELEIIDFYEKIGEKTNSEIEKEIDKRDSLEEKEYVFKDADIYKMHTYKDSILFSSGSYVLYPGTKSKYFMEEDLIIPSVGAFSLTPGNTDIEEDNLTKFIKKVIETLLFQDGLITYEWVSSNY